MFLNLLFFSSVCSFARLFLNRWLFFFITRPVSSIPCPFCALFTSINNTKHFFCERKNIAEYQTYT